MNDLKSRPQLASSTLLSDLASGDRTAIACFGGQSTPYAPAIRESIARGGAGARVIELGAKALRRIAASDEFRRSGLVTRDFLVDEWLQGPPESDPGSGVASHPLVFLSQWATLVDRFEEYPALEASITSATGHSQGIWPALLFAECGANPSDERFEAMLHLVALQGLYTEIAYLEEVGELATSRAGAPMVAVSSVSRAELDHVIARFNRGRAKAEQAYVGLINGFRRFVVCAVPDVLVEFQTFAEAALEKRKQAKKVGRAAGDVGSPVWEWLDASAAFHSVLTASRLETALELYATTVGYSIDAASLRIPVYLGDAEGDVREKDDIVAATSRSQFVHPVRWPSTLLGAAQAGDETVMLDFGPGEIVSNLSGSILKGTGVISVPLSEPRGRRMLEEPFVDKNDWSAWAPRTVTLPDGSRGLDNAFTRATGRPPILLPGMTPTTVDAGIVAAAANAGFVAELAGGGQVNEAIFAERVAELQELLDPGREVVFNALFLDRYLWDLHFAGRGIVFEAARAGAPINGVTVSAGIPEVDEAVALLDKLVAHGMWLNAFKPGTSAQVAQVLKIAKAAPHHTVFMHLEGGRAGGHHSWEDLDELLLDTYAIIRRYPNVVLCVGGGVRDEARAAELIDGSWALAHGRPSMPVDAVFLGTIAMACAEATATEAVKDALATTEGVADWVWTGEVGGGMTSGKSQLNADIHYIENAAAACGRLLDSVAGDADAVEARRDEIIDALSKTAKPFFGEVTDMSWSAVLRRFAELVAIGTNTRYEDGVWLDPSHRRRFAMLIERAEARCVESDEGAAKSVFGDDRFDDPQASIAALEAGVGAVTQIGPDAVDAAWFLHSVCRLPGKPVPFVPAVDADVRRWYKSDSLWQAQHPRYSADEVLVIPGPEAVIGIERANEPVADLLGRFSVALLGEGGGTSTRLRRHGRAVTGASEDRAGRWTAHEDDADWFVALDAEDSLVAEFVGAPFVSRLGKRVANPIRRLARAVSGSTMEWDGATATFRTGDEVTIVRTSDGHVDVVAESEGSTLSLRFDAEFDGGEHRFVEVEPGKAIRGLYHGTLYGEEQETVDPWAPLKRTVTFSGDRASAHARLTGGSGATPTAGLMFGMTLNPLFELLSTEPFAAGLLDLVHARHQVSVLGEWPPADGQELDVEVAVRRALDRSSGRRVETRTQVRVDGTLVAECTDAFVLRGFGDGSLYFQNDDVDATVRLDAGAAVFVSTHANVELRDEVVLSDGDRLTITGTVVGEGNHCHAKARLQRDGETVATFESVTPPGRGRDPLRALVEGIGGGSGPERTEPAGGGRIADYAPTSMADFAWASGDYNPIHVSSRFAALAGFDEPIVHGMWTASRLLAAVGSASGGASVVDSTASFLAPLLPGTPIHITLGSVGLTDGRPTVEARASAFVDGRDRDVCAVEAQLEPKRTAFVFPGQGIQRAGMGMDGYGRSRAARSVWDRADEHTRASLGFSILRIVRENPRSIVVRGETHRHRSGVLHLTQFTQVAMAVLAQAQVAELEEAGLSFDDAITAGHSVGEYNALAAVAKVLPLESVVQIVYRRGLAMHTLVPRDAEGRSGFAMGVIRPHYAGLTHEQAEQLVQQIKDDSGRFLEIVNYNVRGRQYSVTGHEDALDILAERLAERTPGEKAAYIQVPGIDVPFHSRVLRRGVDEFRRSLQECMPSEISPSQLVGKYVPNLLPKPFSISEDYVEEVFGLTTSPILGHVLLDYPSHASKPPVLARILLIELLAYQFASPVRWIEGQEVLVGAEANGGLAATRVVEVGPAEAPTLANMMRYTLSLPSAPARAVDVLNAGADRGRVLYQDGFLTVGDEQHVAPVVNAPADDAPTETAPAAAADAAPAAAAVDAALVVASTGAAPTDRPPGVEELIRAVFAFQAKLRPEQIDLNENIDDLVEGVSSRRNQILLDLGNELGGVSIDGAHEMPISKLIGEVEKRAPGYRAPGPYLEGRVADALERTFRPLGKGRNDVQAELDKTFGLGPGLTSSVELAIALGTRDGDSPRGGALGITPAGASDMIATIAGDFGRANGMAIAPLTSGGGGGGVVDSEALDALERRILGADGALGRLADVLNEAVGAGPGATPFTEAERVSILDAELGEDFARFVTPVFDTKKHVMFGASWAGARADAVRLAYDWENGRLTPEQASARAARLAAFADHPNVASVIRWAAARIADDALTSALTTMARPSFAWTPARPSTSVVDGRVVYSEQPDERADARTRFVESMFVKDETGIRLRGAATHTELRESMKLRAAQAFDFAGETALVTGASPGSIALECVRHLLNGGARVILTTSSYSAKRMEAYREVYQESAGPGAELHVIPYNQGSTEDTDALVEWLFDTTTEPSGATVKVMKEPTPPSIILPFAALGAGGTTNEADARAEAALRIALVGVERLISRIGAAYAAHGQPDPRAHVVLPMSPNTGTFGGDAFYGESKVGLEALLAKWQSESHAWGAAFSMVGAEIGWVRSTGLMDANDLFAAELEANHPVRTFTASEMGFLIAGLCDDYPRSASVDRALRADLTGGLGRIDSLSTAVAVARQTVEDLARAERLAGECATREREALGAAVDTAPPALRALPTPAAPRPALVPWDAPQMDLDRTVVIVGVGEVGPYGFRWPRFAAEHDADLNAGAVAELAWMTGLVDFRDGKWHDAESGAEVAHGELAELYRERVRAAAGIRWFNEDLTGFDMDSVPLYTRVFLERDFEFTVGSEAEARAFVDSAPEQTRARQDGSGVWKVTRLAGSEMRMPRSIRMNRRAGGLVPDGFDFARLGIPNDMIASVDRSTLFSLLATCEAFIEAGVSPEEVLQHLHPTRVGNTQGSGIGGMEALRKLYLDLPLDDERQADVIQETLINVIAGYNVQSLIGGYGPMVNPVSACATAAVSVELAVDKIQCGKADFVVAGGYDDIGLASVLGFGDMGATANSDDMTARGMEPSQFSRANDRRRGGFVEAHGGGTILLASARVARDLALPVHGVVAYAGTFSDGIHRSIPAPGLGIVAAAAGGANSPLGRALTQYGLTTDDIGFASKHDTSTNANDPNENRLHDTIQKALGRSEGNPLLVISQKTITGHSKGGAAAWQLSGACQVFETGRLPGNRNLECPDESVADLEYITLTDRAVDFGAHTPKAALLTSLGFGHVGAILLILRSDAFLNGLSEADRATYLEAVEVRRRNSRRWRSEVFSGQRPLFERRTERHFSAPDGTDAQRDEELAMLLDLESRLVGETYVRTEDS